MVDLLVCCVVLSGCTRATGGLPTGADRNTGALPFDGGRRSEAAVAQQPRRNVAGFKSLYSFKGGQDGSFPLGDLLHFGGELYGTTNGYGNPGTIFKLTTSGKETVLHVFAGGQDGNLPQAGLINVNGTLYGTVEGGGTFGEGKIFANHPIGQANGRLQLRKHGKRSF
jgi:uncharacterized repeat protein (TIGR03803 family)